MSKRIPVFRSLSQLIHWSQVKPEPKVSQPKKNLPPIATSAEISRAAIAKDFSFEGEEASRQKRRHHLAIEDFKMRLARDWKKYLVVTAIYGMTALAWYELTK